MLEEIIRVCQNLRTETSDQKDKNTFFAIQRGLIPLVVSEDEQINVIGSDIRGFISKIFDAFPKKVDPSSLEYEECKKIVLKIAKGI